MKKIACYYLDIIYSKEKNLIKTIICGLLLLLSFIYALILKAIRLYYISHKIRFPIKIISIGNITWGGTGKTPLTIQIARYLINNGVKLAIIYHGRGAKDEINLLKEKLKDVKLYCGKNRKKIIRKILKIKQCDCVILEDGYQQWGIEKDLDILCLNASSLFGNGYLIPRGDLREPLSAIARADLICINKSFYGSERKKLKEKIIQYNNKAPLIFTKYKIEKLFNPLNGNIYHVEELADKNVFIFTAVADPNSVLKLLKDYNINIVGFNFFPDHYNYRVKDLQQILKNCHESGTNCIITTEKDYLRDPEMLVSFFQGKGIMLYLIKIELIFQENEKELFNRLNTLLAIFEP